MSVARAQTVLDLHNCHRARYGVPPLQWDWQLAEDAKKHADECTWGHSTNLQSVQQGENLAAAQPGPVNSAGWFAEESDWDCGVPQGVSCKRGMCGHWTQAIWDTTTKVGCAVTNCPSWMPSDYLVCRYSPPGNYTNRAPVQNCTPNNSINCSNPANANFPRPQVPPLPAGKVEPTEPTIGTGAASEQGQQQQGQPGRPGVRTTLQEMKNQWTQQQLDNQRAQDAAADAQRLQDQLIKQRQQQQQQQQKGDELIVNGVAIYYAPEQKKAVMGLSDADKAELAERLRNVPPFTHPNTIGIYLTEKTREAVGIKEVFPRESQREVLAQLSRAQFADLYNQVKDYPVSVQHCGIEEYLVRLGLAQPTALCTDTRQTHGDILPPEPQPTVTPKTEEQQPQKQGKEEAQQQAQPSKAIDDAKLSANEPVLVQGFIHQAQFQMPIWSWVLVGIAALIVLAAIIAGIWLIVTRSKRSAEKDKDIAAQESTSQWRRKQRK